MIVTTLFCEGTVDAARRFLDGRTADGSVGLGDQSGNFSGTNWTRRIQGDIWTLECLGDFKNPKHKFLDGRTHDGLVGVCYDCAGL
jgi:hypothetical protein